MPFAWFVPSLVKKVNDMHKTYMVVATSFTHINGHTLVTPIWSEIAYTPNDARHLMNRAFKDGNEAKVFGWNGRQTFELTDEDFQRIESIG